jgi:AraC-like DNA-binding protein
MIRFSYQLNDFRHWLGDFGNLLDLPVTGGKMEFPATIGEGFILAVQVPDGFSYAVMDFILNDDLVLFRRGSDNAGLCLCFRPSPILNTTTQEEEAAFPRHTRVKSVALFFPLTFLSRHIRKDILDGLFQCADNQQATAAWESIAFEFKSALEDIYNADNSSPLYRLQLHNRILQLSEKYLQSFLTKTSSSFADGRTWGKGKEKDLEALKSIVRILSDNHLNKFPSIDTLSRTAMMSSTKLKTRFKQIYGMKLYEFYNRNRLEKAREMLKTGTFSVKQVGINIGFSNLSNFAKAFRKEFGMLPKEILKSK